MELKSSLNDEGDKQNFHEMNMNFQNSLNTKKQN